MTIKTTVIGSYPKVSDNSGDNLPGTIDKWQRQVVNDEALNQEIEKVIRRVIQEQEKAGISLLSDGQIRWEDLVHPVARSSSGIRRGALRRFFDNNVYYRRLELNGGVAWTKSSTAEEFKFASRVTTTPVKVALPGPLTLSMSTEIENGRTPEQLLSLYTQLLRQEVEALAQAGVSDVQLDEPSFKAGEPLLNKAMDAIHQIFDGMKTKKWVALYFHDVTPILSSLAQLQVDVLSLDFVAAPALTERLKDFHWKGELAAGLVDARNTKLEKPEDLKRQLDILAKWIPEERLWLTPQCGLEFLPHESALKKLQLLQRTAQG